jgi:hypothetical protein
VFLGIVLVVCMLVLPSSMTKKRDSGGIGTLVRFAAVAALLAVLSGLMYVAYAATGTLISLVLGNATMVLAPAMLWWGLRMLNGTAAIVGVVSLIACLVAVGSTLIAPGWIASGIKVLLLACLCLLIGLETRRKPLSARRAAAPLAVVSVLYAVYCIGRLIVALVVGQSSELFTRAFGTEATTMVSGAVMIGFAVAVILLQFELAPARSISSSTTNVEQLGRALIEHGQSLTTYTMQLPELRLIRAAHGPEQARSVREALVAAIGASLPGAVLAGSRSGDAYIALSVAPPETPSVIEHIREEYAQRVPHVDGADTSSLVVDRQVITDLPGLLGALSTLRSRHPERMVSP